MPQQSVLKRSSAAAAANTDTALFTPAAGVRYKLLSFYAANEVAAQTAGMNFELRVGGNIVAIAGFNSGTAPIGGMTPVAIIAHEFIGDGLTPVYARNLAALAASSVAAFVVSYDANY